MQIAKKWKSAIALFLAVVMAISFAPSIDSKAAITPPITGLSAIDDVEYSIAAQTVTTNVTVTAHDNANDSSFLSGTLVDSNGVQVTGSSVTFANFTTANGGTSTATVNIPAGTPVGTYTVKVYVQGSQDPFAKSFNITKRQIEVPVLSPDATYDGTAKVALAYNYTGADYLSFQQLVKVPADATATNVMTTTTWDVTATSAGTYTISAKLKDTANTEWATTPETVSGDTFSDTFTVAKRQVAVPAMEDSTVAADASEVNRTKTVTSAEYEKYTIADSLRTSDDDAVITEGAPTTVLVKKVGVHNITATLDDAANNKWADGTAAAKLSNDGKTYAVGSITVTRAAQTWAEKVSENDTFIVLVNDVAGTTLDTYDEGSGVSADDRAAYIVSESGAAVKPAFQIYAVDGEGKATGAPLNQTEFTIIGDISSSTVGNHEITVTAKTGVAGTSGSCNFYWTLKGNTSGREGIAIDASSLKFGTNKEETNAGAQSNFVYGMENDKYLSAKDAKKLTPKLNNAGAGTYAASDVKWYYVNADALSGDFEHASATGDFFDLTKTDAAGYAALQDGADEFVSQTKPYEAGNFYVFASIPKTDVFAAYVTAKADLVINPLPLYIVPTASTLTKEFGSADKAIGFSAFTYYNYNKKTYADRKAFLETQLVVTEDPVTKEVTFAKAVAITDEEFEAYKNEYKDITADIAAKTVKDTDALPNATYAGLADASVPVLYRSRTKDGVAQTWADLTDANASAGDYGETVTGSADDAKYLVNTNVTGAFDATSKFKNFIAVNTANTTGTGDTSAEVIDEDTILVVDNGTAGAKLGNKYYTITARNINTQATVAFLDNAATGYTLTPAGNAAAKADWVFGFKTKTNVYAYDDGNAIVPTYRVTDNIYIPEVNSTTGKLVFDDNGFVKYKTDAAYRVGYFLSANATADAVGGNFTPSDNTSGTGSGKYTMNLVAKGNYTGKLPVAWEIGSSKLAYIVTTYEGTNQLKKVSNNKIEKVYDGTPIGFNIVVNPDKVQSTVNSSVQEDRKASDVEIIKFKNLTEFTYADPVSHTIKTVPADDDYVEATNNGTAFFTKMFGAGTYKVGYEVSSKYHNYDTVTGEITITIKQATFTAKGVSVDASVYDTEAEVKAAADRAQNGAAGVTYANMIWGKYDTKYVNTVDGTNTVDTAIEETNHDENDYLIPVYSFDTAALKTAGKTEIKTKLMSQAELKAAIIAGHKAAYLAGTANYSYVDTAKAYNYNAFKVATTIYEAAPKVIRDYSATTDYVTVAGNVKVPLGKVADRNWDSLTEAQVNALIKDDFEQLEFLRRKNDNYSVDFTAGTLTVEPADLLFLPIVHDADAWDAEKKVWKDAYLNESGQYVFKAAGAGNTTDADYWVDTHADENWTYGAYDMTGSKVEVAMVKTTPESKGFYALPEELKSYVTLSVDDLKAYRDMKYTEIDKVLYNIPAADNYTMKADMPAVTGYATKNCKSLTKTDNATYTMSFNACEFDVKAGTLAISQDEDLLKGGSVETGKKWTEVEKFFVTVIGGETAIQPEEDTYELQWYDTTLDATTHLAKGWSKFPTYALDMSDNNVDGTQTFRIKAVPTTKGAASLKPSAEVSVKVTVTPTAAGENDKVRNITMLHTADEKGKTIELGKKVDGGVDYSFTKDYGKYTANKQLKDGSYEKAADQSYVYEQRDNTKEYSYARGALDLEEYIENELLYANGYAVVNQNTNLYWTTNDAGKQVLARYADAEKVPFLPYLGLAEGTHFYAGYDDEDITAGYRIQEALDTKGNYTYAATTAIKDDDPIIAYANDDGVSIIDEEKNENLAMLLEGITITAEVTDNKDGVIGTEQVTSNGQTVTRDLISVDSANRQISYTLAEDAKSGNAVITVTVHRLNYSDITFDVNVMVDADVPQILVKNVEVGKEASDKVNTKADFTTYVNTNLVFDVTVVNAEKGAWYYWSDEVLGELDLNDEYALDQNRKPEDKVFTALEGETVTTPDKDGKYILYVRAEDESGNVTWASSANGFTLDKTAPVVKNAEDTEIVYGETVKDIVVDEGKKGTIIVTEAELKSLTMAIGDAEPVDVTINALTKSYELDPNEKTYTITATDKAGNVTKALINVLKKVDNSKNDLTVTYDGKTIDLKTLKVDDKALFTISENAGEASYSDVTEEKKDDKYVYAITGARGEGKVEDGVLTVTKAGTFAIKLHTAQNGIYGPTDTVALLTVNRGVREVGISLVDGLGTADEKAKTSFSDTEAKNIIKYAKLTFSDGSAAPAAECLTFKFYKKGETTALTDVPTDAGEYEVAVEITDDPLFDATKSIDSTVEALKDLKKASFTLGAGNKIKIVNDDTKGTVKVTDATGAEITDLDNVAKGTKVTVEVTPVAGVEFDTWTVTGFTPKDVKATKLEGIEIANDIELTTSYLVAIVITKQPASLKLYADEKATFTVEATGNGADDLTYQWMVKGAGAAGFTNIVDATAATYEIAKVAATDNGSEYKVVITSKASGKTLESEVAKLEVIGNSIEGAVVELEAASAEYTGKAIVPVVKSVKLGDTVLAATRDYEVVATNFVNVGEYTVTVKAIGDYSGEASAKFTITPKALTADMFSIEDVQYTGKAIEAPVVSDLVADTDYTVAYKNNTEVGTATATMTGKGNYTGSVDVKFNIIGESIAKATVTGISTAAYTGKAITPTPVVKLNGKTLKKGTDYTVSYKNNTKVGTATVTITGKGDYSGK
ncbi:MAG: hypothetical protein IKO61_01180, partial [Lachnospiraceae bacterium]|nr:hypothetical protein [Lachnospiraceae bacterium]